MLKGSFLKSDEGRNFKSNDFRSNESSNKGGSFMKRDLASKLKDSVAKGSFKVNSTKSMRSKASYINPLIDGFQGSLAA